MAYFGLSTPIIAKLSTSSAGVDSYSEGFKCGKATGTSITPNYSESKLYGDNSLAEYVKVFSEADVTVSVTELPVAAVSVIFGHTVDSSTNEVNYKVTDDANYVGYGFYASEIRNGDNYYSACWLPKVKFAEGADSYTTKGENIEFSAPELSGKAMADSSGNWKYVKQNLTSESAAVAWLNSKANITG